MDFTQEQKAVLSAVAAGDNVQLLAVAGAGKTRTLLEACRLCKGKTVLILTYNRALADDCKRKLRHSGGLAHVNVHTFHSLAHQHLGPASNDDDLHYTLANPDPSRQQVCWDMVIVDEAQDMRRPFLVVLQQVLASVQQMVVCGDPMQLLYDYVQDDPASEEFLLHPEQHFASLVQRPWKHLTLSTSWRLTPSLATFVNKLGGLEQPITGGRIGAGDDLSNGCVPELWIFQSMWSSAVEELVHRHVAEVGPERVLVLAHSLNPSGPVGSLANKLSSRGVRLQLGDAGGGDGKLRIATFCKAKGLEADVVLVLGVDGRLADLTGQEYWNSLHVALTRARDRLLILGEAGAGVLPRMWDMLFADGPPLLRIHAQGAQARPAARPRAAPGSAAPTTTLPLSGDAWVMSLSRQQKESLLDMGQWQHSPVSVGALSEGETLVVDVGSDHTLHTGYEDATAAYVMAVLICLETEASGGMCADVERLLSHQGDAQSVPMRISPHDRFHQGGRRPLTRATLLPSDLCPSVKRAHTVVRAQVARPPHWLCLGATLCAWDSGFYHTMRQLLPVERWCDERLFTGMLGHAQQAMKRPPLASLSPSGWAFNIPTTTETSTGARCWQHLHAHHAEGKVVVHFTFAQRGRYPQLQLWIRCHAAHARLGVLVDLNTGVVDLLRLEEGMDG